jgi:hypothetical protein
MKWRSRNHPQLKLDAKIYTAKGAEIGLDDRYLKWYEESNDNIQP